MLTGKITDYDGQILTIVAEFSDLYIMERWDPKECEIRLIDSRAINADQRKKAHALMRDISLYSGHTPEEIKEIMKFDFISRTGCPEFSLSDVDMSTAREFITHLINFCLEWGVPCRDSLLEMTDDIGKYLYLCLYHKKCCICGRKAEIHHVDHVGMGNNRKEICHVGYRVQALCRRHHNEAHLGQKTFDRKYYVYGIKIDEILAKRLNLGKSHKGDIANGK
jgi:hypothetical protein